MSVKRGPAYKPNLCFGSIWVNNLILEGRRQEAEQSMIKLLRDGYYHPRFNQLVADYIEEISPNKERKKPGRPPKLKPGGVAGAACAECGLEHIPSHWMDVGRRFEQLRDAGCTHEEALRRIAAGEEPVKAFSQSEVEKRVRFYRAFKRALARLHG